MKRLLALVRELGAGWAVLYLLHRLFAAQSLPVSLYAYRLVRQPVPDRASLGAARRARFSCRLLEPQDPMLAATFIDEEILDYRFSQGAQCYGLFKEDRLIAWLWLVKGAYEEDEVRARFLLAPDCVWDFDVYIHPDHRLGFAFAALWDAVNEDLHRHSIRWTISRISAFNAASLRSHARMGATPCGGLVFLSFGSVQLMLGSRRPFMHLGLRRGHGPEIHFSSH
ncbi:hypothetical protein JCM17844_01020 [Iodidimonas gelatinilytica]|uniref:N-acetyltransferase domain-containing protein n=1 Tax=Iodidimonas gelatinilytica TaxID=1236966 RepID=A0A5A7MN69_9PROT|nr:N-acetyltransferase [Iodidimonas gelatinilytica]GEQ96465.1 hypothetical protein JCM17844_01020 [Iodidimonas gelatinilytica]